MAEPKTTLTVSNAEAGQLAYCLTYQFGSGGSMRYEGSIEERPGESISALSRRILLRMRILIDGVLQDPGDYKS